MSASEYRLRPSAAGTWVFCNGSVQLAAQFPEEDGPEAAEGTAGHWVATEALQNRFHPVGTVAPNGVVVNQEMIDHSALFSAVVLQTMPADKCHVEHMMPAPEIHAENGGTPDVWGWGYEAWTLHIVDYKYGHRFVEAFENWQCLDYLSAIISHLKAAGEWGYGYEERVTVIVTIVQPRNYHRDGPVREWRFPLAQAEAFFNILRYNAERSLSPDAMCVAGDYCYDCSARRGCDTLQTASMRAVATSGQAVAHNLSPIETGNELRLLEAAAEVMGARIDGLRVEALSLLKSGKSVPHYVAESTYGREVWFEGKEEEVIQLGDVLGKNLRVKQKPITPVQARATGIDPAVIAEYAHRPRGEVKLVPLDQTKARKIFGGNTP